MEALPRAVTGAVLVLAWLPACGFITGGAAAAASDETADPNAPSTVSDIQIVGAKKSPAVVSFRLSDPESDLLEVELRYDIPGQGTQRMTALFEMAQSGSPTPGDPVANSAFYDSSAGGTVHSLFWKYSDESGLTDATLLQGIRVIVVVPGGIQDLTSSSLVADLGNDPPVVESVEPMPSNPADPFESSGNVEIRLVLSDSSSDPTDVTIEWRRAQDAPDTWESATAAGVFPTGIETVPAETGGVSLSFFWATNIDLQDEEDEVFLRVTADDRTDIGLPFETHAVLRIDNNEEPIVSIGGEAFVLNIDRRKGIPVPYEVFDEEEDLVEVIFQWRRPGESFPDLPSAASAIQAILDDPILRKEHRIATEYPTYAEGRVVPVSAACVRLPEFARGTSTVRAGNIVGCELEILRGSGFPEPVSWSSNPLSGPVAALPIGNGLSALVLEHSTSGWRVREIELATGFVLAEVVAGVGTPTTMAFGSGEESLLVASILGGWQVERFDITSGTGVVAESVGGPLTSLDGIRGLVALGTGGALVTIDDAVLRLNFAENPPTATQLLAGLGEPWGIVLDPLQANHAYIALRAENRVVDFNLGTRELREVAAMAPGGMGLALPSPRALALEKHGARLLVLVHPGGEPAQLRSLNLRNPTDLDRDGRADPTVFELARNLEARSSIATGLDGLRLLSLPMTNKIAVGGGVEQIRTVAEYDPVKGIASVAEPFGPPPDANDRWRVPLASCPESVGSHSFVWDSQDAGGTGFAHLRALPVDSELGQVDETVFPKRIAFLGEQIIELGDPTVMDDPGSVASGDLDGDGDLDLVSTNGGSDALSVFFQSSPGIFDSAPIVLGDSSATDGRGQVIAADLEGDGDLDLASTNFGSNNISVFFQTDPGVFGPLPLILGDDISTQNPAGIAAADLDGDGDLDLVSAISGRDWLVVYFQISPGVFNPTPLLIKDSASTDLPFAVAAADFDGDGDLDLVSANLASKSDTLTVFFQSSPGVFDSTPLVLGGPGTTHGPRSVAGADLDGDGDIDIVSANSGSDTLTVFFQTSSGRFDSDPLVLGNPITTSFGSSSVLATDLDGDGDLDLISTSFVRGLVANYQIAPGVFESTPALLQAQSGVSFAVTDDLDGDGDIDIVSANLDSDSLTIFLQGGRAVAFDPGLLSLDETEANIGLKFLVSDLDGDGDLDMASADEGRDILAVYFQSGSGAFDPTPLVLGGSGTTNRPFSVASGDLDGDGDLDLVSANLDGDDLTIFVQSCPRVFESAPIVLGSFATTKGPASVVPADIDGDGDLDVISANLDGNDLTVFFQSGQGIFDSRPLVIGAIGTTDSPLVVAAADLDGDGDLDLVSGNSSSDTLTVFFQGDSGAFDTAPLVLGGPGVTDVGTSVVIEDLDGDGDLDLVSSNFNGDSLTVFFQIGAGVFDSKPLVLKDELTTDGAFSVAAADFDGDGDMDLVSANILARTWTLFLQTELGLFDPSPIVVNGPATDLFPGSAVAADLDGDGDPDLLLGFTLISGDPTVLWNRD